MTEQIDEAKQILRLMAGKVECLRNELERDVLRAMDLLDQAANAERAWATPEAPYKPEAEDAAR